jgi:hypothetical protein
MLQDIPKDSDLVFSRADRHRVAAFGPNLSAPSVLPEDVCCMVLENACFVPSLPERSSDLHVDVLTTDGYREHLDLS